MKIIGEKTLYGKTILTPTQFIEDLTDRINGVTTKILKLEDEKMQLRMTLSFLKAFKGRLNRVSEK